MFKSKLRKIQDALDKFSPVFGRTFYVMASSAARYEEFVQNKGSYLNGVPKVYTNVSDALAKAEAWDAIRLNGGDYDEGKVINITKEGVKLLGPGIDNQHVAMIWSNSASHHLITVNAHNVEIAGIGLTQTKDTYDAIRVSTTASYFKCHIHDCRLDGYSAGEYGIHTGDTYDSPDIKVERCVFRSWQTASIFANTTRGLYCENKIFVDAGKDGIVYYPNGGDRPGSMILNNRFLTTDNSAAEGIKMSNTPTAGTLMVDGNHFVYFADDDHCISVRTGLTGLNYLGITAIAIT